MINLFWYDGGFNNLGDSINPFLTQKLSGEEAGGSSEITK
jgi:hypothetical protein